MAYFYNFNFDENKMYCMPIEKFSISVPSKYKRVPLRYIEININDYPIPSKSRYWHRVDGRVFTVYTVHESPETVYRRCFWMEERDDEKAKEIKNRYLEERAKKKAEKCHYCDTEENKDIFFNWLPAMFGLEKEDHDYNPDVTVFITDEAELELCAMMGDDYLVKEKKKINYCPFCGRRLRND